MRRHRDADGDRKYETRTFQVVTQAAHEIEHEETGEERLCVGDLLRNQSHRSSPTQINFQVPWELGLGDGTAPFTVTMDGPATKGTRAGSPVDATFGNIVAAPIKTYGPGVFLARRADGSAVADATPVSTGDVIVLYATGLGPVSTTQATGVLASSTNLVTTTQVPVVTIGGARAEILFSGLTPGTAGVYQINLRVPVAVPTGSAALVVTIGNESSVPYRLATR